MEFKINKTRNKNIRFSTPLASEIILPQTKRIDEQSIFQSEF